MITLSPSLTPNNLSSFVMWCLELKFRLGKRSPDYRREDVFMRISLSSDLQAMGPRRKASKLQPAGGSGGGELIPRPSEPKDYINELSHEVLCHIFRYIV